MVKIYNITKLRKGIKMNVDDIKNEIKKYQEDSSKENWHWKKKK